MVVTEKMSQKKLTIRFTAKNLRLASNKTQAQETAPCLNVDSDSKLKLTSELVLDVAEEKKRRMDQVQDLVNIPSTTVTEKMSEKKLTIKFTAKNLRRVSERQAQETAPNCSNVKSDTKLKQPGFSNKRKSELVLDVPEGKRRKMDQFLNRHCSNILKELLSHHAARIFSQPLDPVALRIPDYFSIISDPMDLGTIKSKLEDNRYLSSEEFAADVCLTFSNAMLYNPPNSSAHQHARNLDQYFKRRWKYQLASWNHQNKGVGLNIHNNGSGLKKTQDSADFFSKKLKSDIASGAKKNSTAVEEKHGLRKEVMVILRSLKSSEKLRRLLQRFNLKEGNLGPNISALGVSALKEFKRALKCLSDSNCANLMPTKTKVNGLDSLSGKVVRKGACTLVKSKPSVSSVSPLCGLCRDGQRQCRHQKRKVPATSSNVSEKSLKEVNHATNTKSRDSKGKVLLTHGRVSDHDDTNGHGRVLGEDNNNNTLTNCSLPVPSSTDSGCIPVMDDESFKKALRVAMLKSRFADTIMKANADKTYPKKLHQERERLERLQREAAKIDTQEKEEQKMIIKKKRQSARLALEKIEKTVVFEDSLRDLRELELLSQRSLAAFGVKFDKRTSQCRRPVELFGLVLKEEEDDDEEVEQFLNEEREEGEILQ